MLREQGYLLLLLPLLTVLVTVFAVPIARILASSVLEPEPGLAHYAAVIANDLYRQVFVVTLRVSLIVTLAAILLGYPVAYVAARAHPVTRNLIFALVLVPFWTSLLVRIYGWTVILQRAGIVNETLRRLGIVDAPLKLLYTEGAVVLGILHFLLPFMIFSIYASLSNVDPRLARAAMTMGARPLRAFLAVTLPLSLPGVWAGSLLVFISSLGFFVTPALMGGPRQMMIANLIDFQAKEALNWPLAAAMAAVLLLLVALLAWAYFRLLGPDRTFVEGA